MQHNNQDDFKKVIKGPKVKGKRWEICFENKRLKAKGLTSSQCFHQHLTTYVYFPNALSDVPAKGWKIQARNNKKKEGSGDARSGCKGRTAVRGRQKPGVF